jgi:hypothetical protein
MRNIWFYIGRFPESRLHFAANKICFSPELPLKRGEQELGDLRLAIIAKLQTYLCANVHKSQQTAALSNQHQTFSPPPIEAAVPVFVGRVTLHERSRWCPRKTEMSVHLTLEPRPM